MTRGIGPAGVPPPDNPRPTVIVAVNPLPVFPAAIYDAGLTAHVASGRRNERAMTAGLKTLAYADAVAAWLEARRAGADEALFLDIEGHCSEATSSNLFVWTDSGTLLTPPVSCGALPGVTRGAVLELARARGMPGGERAFGLDELLAAKEAFLTSSAARDRAARAGGGAADRPRHARIGHPRDRGRVRRARGPGDASRIVILETIVTTVAERRRGQLRADGRRVGSGRRRGRHRAQAVPRDGDLPQRARDAAPRSST